MTHTPDGMPPRYARRPLPRYAHRPGRTPHPVRHPAGHAHGAADARVRGFDPLRWRECEPWLAGVDLFNRGFYWEAHEAWEALWRAAGRRSPSGRRLQGLIQLAGACLKRELGARYPARRLAAAGREKLRDAPEGFLGLEVALLCDAVTRWVGADTPEPPRMRLRADDDGSRDGTGIRAGR